MAGDANRKRSGRRNNEHRGGQRGNTRGKERQVTRRKRRMQDPRVREALAEARRQDRDLENQTFVQNVSLPEHEHSDIYIGDPPRYVCCFKPVPESELAVEPTPTPRRRKKVEPPALPVEGEGNGCWTLGQARSLLRQGYTLTHAVNATGFGTKWFDDIELEDDRVPI